MQILAYIIFFVYFIAMLYVTIFCISQLHLLFKYFKKHLKPSQDLPQTLVPWPRVTIQLPLYNEKFVVERLIDNMVQMEYPKDRFDIQILDDSNDQTTDLAEAKCQEYRKQGYSIVVIRRPHRTGFKAGALQHGLQMAQGEFIAIFDADFLPRPNFLKETMKYFGDPKIGVVQTKWEHINQDYSLLTELQAFQLNVHFTIEQVGREKGGYFLQFNGTGGIWRKTTIIDAGGWQADTLTEDLDLSYRAQLKGWKIHYLENIGSPAELPAEMNGLKSQQYRWMKGGAETAKKTLPVLWQSDLQTRQKIHATLHLLSSAVFVFILVLAILSVPMLFFFRYIDVPGPLLSSFLIGLASVFIVYFTGNTRSEDTLKPNLILKIILLFPLFMALSMGMSLHNSIAVIQGYRGRKSGFIRTPKFNITSRNDLLRHNQYTQYKLNWTTIFEGVLALYFALALAYGFLHDMKAFTGFHLLLTIGFGTIFYYSVRHLGLKQ